MVAVHITGTKQRINNEAAPIQLQRLKAFAVFVSGFDTMALKCIIVVHHHGIQTQHDQLWLYQLQAPQEKLQQYRAKHVYRRPINRLEKTLHRMRGKHLLGLSLDASGITFITLQCIKVNQMPAGTIQKKAKQLLEDFCHRLALAAFADATKLGFQMRQQPDAPQVSHKKAQSTTASQGVVCNLNTIEPISKRSESDL
jgi:hypothetical protein